MADSVISPYLVMALVLFLLGILIRKAPLPNVAAAPMQEVAQGEMTKTSIFQFPHLWLGVLALFMYVGAEVIAGDTIIAYGHSLGLGEKSNSFTMFTLMAMVATYAIGVVLIPKYVSQSFALKTSAILGIIVSFCVVFTSGFTSVLFVAALGVANALVWPAIWPLTLKGLGKFTKTASALLIMAICGGAILPPMYGALVDYKKEELVATGIHEVSAFAEAASFGYWILLPCYVIILYYAFWGHKLGVKE